MHQNIYWNIATRGALLPSTFDLVAWDEAFNAVMRGMENAYASFEYQPGWDTYNLLGRGVNRANCLTQVLCFMPLFLPGAEEAIRVKRLEDANKELQTFMAKAQEAVRAFLGTQLETDERAKAEQGYWYGFSPKTDIMSRIQNTLNDETHIQHVQYKRLSGMDQVSHLKRKLRNQAKDLGLSGYAVDPRDWDMQLLMTVQREESMRQNMWGLFQHHSLPQADVDRLLTARHEIAEDTQTQNYLRYVNPVHQGVPLHAVEKSMTHSLGRLAPVLNKLDTATLQQAMDGAGWEGGLEKAQLPWNKPYLLWQEADAQLDLEGREFPLERVISHIIPAIMRMGGWECVGKAERIGRGKKSMYLYHLHKNGKLAHMYFAAHPGQDVKPNDAYAAYACMLRERWTGGKPTTPIVLVGQNFVLHKGCLADLDQLRYLVHELGHVLHFLSMPAQTFDEFGRMQVGIGELPSVLMENLIQDPHLLRQWCNPKYKKGRQTKYWVKRVRKDALGDHAFELERALLDMKVHKKATCNLKHVQNRLRKATGLPALHPLDHSAYLYFDRTDGSAAYYGYVAGRALSAAMINGATHHEHTAQCMQVLLDQALANPHGIERGWKRVYGQTLAEMFDQGLKVMEKQIHQEANRQLRNLRARRRKRARKAV